MESKAIALIASEGRSSPFEVTVRYVVPCSDIQPHYLVNLVAASTESGDIQRRDKVEALLKLPDQKTLTPIPWVVLLHYKDK